jgi:hypothetical protein
MLLREKEKEAPVTELLNKGLTASEILLSGPMPHLPTSGKQETN